MASAKVEQVKANIPTIRVMGVPEHFNYSWRIGQDKGFFEKYGVKVEFVLAPGGTGAMIAALKKGEVDMIVALTEGLVSDIAKGSDLRLVGTYVKSKLCWAVTTGMNSDIESVADLKDGTFAVSRYTSGSHLMSFLLAKQQKWDPQKDIKFKVTGGIGNLLKSVNDGVTDAFLWETFTTKPYHDSKVARRIGEITTPWPCFMMACREPVIEQKGEAIQAVLKGINEACAYFSAENTTMPDIIAKEYKLKPEDAQQWYNGVQVVGEPAVPKTAINQAIEVLKEVKVLDSTNVDPKDMVMIGKLVE